MWSPATNSLDIYLVHQLNSLVGIYPYFDQAILWLYMVNFVKGAVFISIFWWCWFRRTDASTAQRTREHVLSTLFASLLAIVLARFLALSLPFRTRPRFEPAVHFVLPSGATPNDMLSWSGFPSDHAVMFAALATGLFFISWPLGVLAMFYVVFIISFPRVYLGVHYPTDILVGVLVGGILSYFLNLPVMRRHIAGPAMRWEAESPGGFYVAFFILSFQFSTMFNSLQKVAVSAVHLLGRLMSST